MRSVRRSRAAGVVCRRGAQERPRGQLRADRQRDLPGAIPDEAGDEGLLHGAHAAAHDGLAEEREREEARAERSGGEDLRQGAPAGEAHAAEKSWLVNKTRPRYC